MIHKTKLLSLALLLLILLSPSTALAWSSIAAVHHISGKLAYPGDSTEFTIKVEKGQNYSDDAWCKLQIRNLPQGWNAGFYEGNEQVNGLFFQKGTNQPVELYLRIKIPDNATDGMHSVWVDLIPNEGDTITREFSITIDRHTEPSIEIFSITPGMETRAVDSVKYPITIVNKHSQRACFTLSIQDLPANWKAEFLKSGESSDQRLTKVSVAAGSNQDLLLRVRPGINTSNGVYSIKVLAVPENGKRGACLPLSLSINNGLEKDKTLSITQSAESIIINPGSSEEIYVTLINSGDKTLRNINLRVQEASGVTAQVRSFGTISELKPGETWDTSVLLTVRADASPGTKEILMRAVGDDAQSPDGRLEVIVEKSESSGFIGIGLVLFAVVVLIVIVSKFGRR